MDEKIDSVEGTRVITIYPNHYFEVGDRITVDLCQSTGNFFVRLYCFIFRRKLPRLKPEVYIVTKTTERTVTVE